MSTFEDVNVSGADVRHMPLMTEAEQSACLWLLLHEVYHGHAMAEVHGVDGELQPIALKLSGRPRTALPLLGPWAPPVASGRWILYHPDGVIGNS